MRTSDPDRKLSISYEKVFREGTCGHMSVREVCICSLIRSLTHASYRLVLTRKRRVNRNPISIPNWCTATPTIPRLTATATSFVRAVPSISCSYVSLPRCMLSVPRLTRLGSLSLSLSLSLSQDYKRNKGQICGCPLDCCPDENGKTGTFYCADVHYCREPRRRCTLHISWESVRRAELLQSMLLTVWWMIASVAIKLT